MQLRIFNPESCAYTFKPLNLESVDSLKLEPYSMQVEKHIYVKDKLELQYEIISTDPACPDYKGGSQVLTENAAWSLFLNSLNETESFWLKDYVNKPSDSYPLVRTLAKVQQQRRIVWKSNKEEYAYNANETNLVRVASGDYAVSIDNNLVGKFSIRTGGVYTLLVNEVNGEYEHKLVEVTEPNSMNILWLIPQYVVMTLGEVMFSVTGLEFSYAQAPPSMKSVLQACWLLTVAFGNVIVVIIAEAALFESQASEFFLFAGLMFADMLLFMFMAYNYKPNDPNKNEEVEPLTNGENRDIPPLDMGIDNKAQSINE